MPFKVLLFLLTLCIVLGSCTHIKQSRFKSKQEGKTVEIIETNGTYQLYRNGSAYFIKGAGGSTQLEEIKKAGGNSIRIYDTDHAQEILDKAQELGLTVTLGLKVAKSITEMDYTNKAKVAAQLARLRKEVLKYKNHPALLMWGIGNEPTVHVHPSLSKPKSLFINAKTLLAVNDIAKMVHELDPNHPTTVMLQGVPPKKTTTFISLFCPDIDLLSFNVFMSLDQNIPELIKEKGWNGPYVLSEYGTEGYWYNLPQTDWYGVYEPTSSEKANFIKEAYQKNIQSQKEKCLGSYVFYWGQKHEFTSTWFSLFTEDGKQTGMIDVLHYLWKNEWPANKAPKINSLQLNQRHPLQNIYLQADGNFEATFKAEDVENERLTLYWEILEDENDKFFNSTYNQKKPKTWKNGGYQLWKLKEVAANNLKNKTESVYQLKFKTPKVEGAYRLFIFIRDEQEKVATANAPFYVLPTQY